MANTVIIIPARYQSTRFPGKPLHPIAGREMIYHVYETARNACQENPHCEAWVATDDERIMQFANAHAIPCIMTPSDCPTGTDRVLAAVDALAYEPDYVINLQGDTPLTPVAYINKLIAYLEGKETIDAATLAVNLSWQLLDAWRQAKIKTPHSGTSVVIDNAGDAIWFSKQILPTLRDEHKLREQSARSPVYRHVGIYGYSLAMLKTFVRLARTRHEQLEGLEQLRLLEHGYTLHVIEVSQQDHDTIGVDTLEDAQRVERLMMEKSEPA